LVDAFVVHQREQVVDVILDADAGRIGRSITAAGAAVVPRHRSEPAVGGGERRPRIGRCTEAVGDDNRWAVAVVTPSDDAGAVGTGEVEARHGG
jgi:hypothetical protein